VDPLRRLAEKHGIYLVEDAAQAHLAEYKGKPIGGLGIGSSFSFYPGKNLGAYGEAGAVVTNDDTLGEKIKYMRDHGMPQKYNHEMFGHNYRMEGIQGAVLGVKLNHLEKWTQGRRRAADKYRELLSNFTQIKLPREMDYARHVYHLFVIQVQEGGSVKRDKLAEYLKNNQISTGLHYPIPLHLQKCFSELGYKHGDFAITEKLSETGLSLPMFPELTHDQISYIADKIREFFKTDK
jgi:dTDP-4-amino-4,6-dideoxygalactose transaminase